MEISTELVYKVESINEGRGAMVKKVIQDNLQHPGLMASCVILIMLVMGFAEWGVLSEIKDYRQILEPQHMFSMLKYLSPILLTALTRGIIKQ